MTQTGITHRPLADMDAGGVYFEAPTQHPQPIEEEICHYSHLPHPSSYMQSKEEDIDEETATYFIGHS